MHANTLTTLANYKRTFDIELTNRCNALCHFCPRDETPQQGFMSFDTFKQAIHRAEELETLPAINTTGQGEPLIHPEIEKFVRYCGERDIPHAMTTNASLLTRQKAENLLDAGLKEISISVSDLREDYEDVYVLEWNNTLENILTFMEANQNRAEVTINMVSHEYNHDKIEAMKDYWRQYGIDNFLVFNQTNRGGACKHGNLFQGNVKYFEEAEAILREAKVSAMCSAPFIYLFVGWNGNYYICCNDYRKTTPLGNVFDHSIEEMDAIKKLNLSHGIQACVDCNIDPINKIREKLFEIEQDIATPLELDSLVSTLSAQQKKQPEELNVSDWKPAHHVGVENNLIAVKNL